MGSFDGFVTLREPVQLNRTPRSTFGEVMRATFDETLVSNPMTASTRMNTLEAAYRSDQVLDAATARARLTEAGLEQHLRIPDAGIPAPALDILVERKREELKRQDVLSRARGGAGMVSARIAVALAGSLLDPLNIASAFVPVVGEARYAALLGRVGGGIVGRTAVRAGVGAVEGAAGAALVEPIIASSKALEQADYDMADSLLNVAFGGVFGAGLHVMGGATADVWRFARGSAGDTMARLPPETRTQTLKTAIAQSAGGERVNVEPIVRLEEPDPFAPRSSEERLDDAYFREQLTAMRGETGWSEVGGKLITRAAYDGDPNPEVVGRTAWLPRADWWPDRPAGMSEDEVQTAIEKALAGEELGPRQKELVDYLLDVASERRKTEPFAAMPDELAAVGLADSIDARMEAGVVARAAEVDELAVERAALQYENDPDAFLKAVKEIADRAPARESLPARAPSTAQQAERLGDVRRAADEPKLSVVADERAAAEADDFLAENPAPDDELAAVTEETDEILASLKEQGEEIPEGALAEFDKLAADAESYSKAARAAVLCGFDHA